jgi:hypothetical protein
MVGTYAEALTGDEKQMETLRRRAREIGERWEGPEKEIVQRTLREFPDALARNIASRRAAVDVDSGGEKPGDRSSAKKGPRG